MIYAEILHDNNSDFSSNKLANVRFFLTYDEFVRFSSYQTRGGGISEYFGQNRVGYRMGGKSVAVRCAML